VGHLRGCSWEESAGYPAPVLPLLQQLCYAQFTLAEDFPSADIIVKIGPKAGILDLEPVTDEATGKEIRSASVTLRRAANPDSFLSASTTQGRVFVPAFAEVLIEISAEGYKLWAVPGPSGGREDQPKTRGGAETTSYPQPGPRRNDQREKVMR